MAKIFGQELSKRYLNGNLTAKKADKYHLYQLSVQSPEPDIKFINRVYRKARGKKAKHFREDFCGTCLLTATWVNQGKDFTAESYDIDPEPLAWGKKYNLEPLGKVADRAIQRQQDVRVASLKKPDVRCAQNFSYWIFKLRCEMLDYFKQCHKDLAKDGVFVMDIHGGPESITYMEEESELEHGFSYVWDQDEFWPVTSEATMKIHFRFKDGTEMKNAFTYNWRVWTIPELKELLDEAGFKQIDCYWEGTAADGESGNGIFKVTQKGTNDLSWVAYLVALK